MSDLNMKDFLKIAEQEIKDLHEGKPFAINKGRYINFIFIVIYTIIYLPKILYFKLASYFKSKNESKY